MKELVRHGVRFSIDDFGTGYSSLGYLRKLPIHELKIDRTFINDLPHDANACAIVQSILAMAGPLGLKVVAEGVETVDQSNYLDTLGCESKQGYLFSMPVALEEWLEQL
jgi:EAL domain-containing protein (putative c-di-GMP-specific phosphodiesterase class I)